MEEIWKDIVDYNNLYQVSNLGRVKRLETNITIFNKKTQYNKKVKGKILKNTKDKKGYLYVTLCKNGKTKKQRVHKLVAEAFLQKNNGFNEINHKNEKRDDNRVDNLEYCTHIYNLNYGNHNKKLSKSLIENSKVKIKIIQMDTKGNILNEFESLMEASRQTNIPEPNICACCKGVYKQTHNFIFKYKELPIKK